MHETLGRLLPQPSYSWCQRYQERGWRPVWIFPLAFFLFFFQRKLNLFFLIKPEPSRVGQTQLGDTLVLALTQQTFRWLMMSGGWNDYKAARAQEKKERKGNFWTCRPLLKEKIWRNDGTAVGHSRIFPALPRCPCAVGERNWFTRLEPKKIEKRGSCLRRCVLPGRRRGAVPVDIYRNRQASVPC